MDEDLPALADAIYRERVLRARTLPLSKKMGLGVELYEEALKRMRSGIKAQFPDARSEKVEEMLRERLNRLTKLHEHGIFEPVEPAL